MSRASPRKILQICPKCTGYMQLQNAFEPEAQRRNWKDDTYHRAFGGVQLKRFLCEKCGHTQTFQIDDLKHLEEDE